MQADSSGLRRDATRESSNRALERELENEKLREQLASALAELSAARSSRILDSMGHGGARGGYFHDPAARLSR